MSNKGDVFSGGIKFYLEEMRNRLHFERMDGKKFDENKQEIIQFIELLMEKVADLEEREIEISLDKSAIKLLNDKHQEENKKLMEAYNESKKSNDKLQEEYKELMKESETLSAKNNELNELIKSMKDEVAMKEQLTKMSEQYKEVKSKDKELQINNFELNKDNADLVLQLKNTEGIISSVYDIVLNYRGEEDKIIDILSNNNSFIVVDIEDSLKDIERTVKYDVNGEMKEYKICIEKGCKTGDFIRIEEGKYYTFMIIVKESNMFRVGNDLYINVHEFIDDGKFIHPNGETITFDKDVLIEKGMIELDNNTLGFNEQSKCYLVNDNILKQPLDVSNIITFILNNN